MQKINKKFFILLCRHLTIKGQEDAQNAEHSEYKLIWMYSQGTTVTRNAKKADRILDKETFSEPIYAKLE